MPASARDPQSAFRRPQSAFRRLRSAFRRRAGAAPSPAVPCATSRHPDADARSHAPTSAIPVQAAWLARTNDVGDSNPSNIYIARFGIKDPGPIRTFLLNFVLGRELLRWIFITGL